jgi:hypothetical protein
VLNAPAVGVTVDNTLDNLLMRVSAVNSGQDNFRVGQFGGTFFNDFRDVAALHAEQVGISVQSNLNGRFDGLVVVGGNLSGDCAGFDGLSGNGAGATNCQAEGASTATILGGLDASLTYVGKVVADDVANADDTLGAALHDAIADFTSFDNAFRGWGQDDAAAFPAAAHRGPCDDGDACRIWDARLRASDATLRARLVLPTGDDVIVHAWQALNQAQCDAVRGAAFDGTNCTSTFLQSAVELGEDGVGNDNLLCESGEACLYTPNIGSYQGEGALVSAGAFTDGILTGITLFARETNGAP